MNTSIQKGCVTFSTDIKDFIKSIKSCNDKYEMKKVILIIQQAFRDKGYILLSDRIMYTHKKHKTWQSNFYPWLSKALGVLKSDKGSKSSLMLCNAVKIICHQHRHIPLPQLYYRFGIQKKCTPKKSFHKTPMKRKK